MHNLIVIRQLHVLYIKTRCTLTWNFQHSPEFWTCLTWMNFFGISIEIKSSMEIHVWCGREIPKSNLKTWNVLFDLLCDLILILSKTLRHRRRCRRHNRISDALTHFVIVLFCAVPFMICEEVFRHAQFYRWFIWCCLEFDTVVYLQNKIYDRQQCVGWATGASKKAVERDISSRRKPPQN